MDGRGGVFNNIYLQCYSDAKELKHGLKSYFDFYNEGWIQLRSATLNN